MNSVKVILLAVYVSLSANQMVRADTQPEPIQFTMRLGNQNFNTSNATGKILVVKGTPIYEAVVVRYSTNGAFMPLSSEDIKNAVWRPYDGMIRMDFGPMDGIYDVGEAARPNWLVSNTISAMQREPPRTKMAN
jgi:hypothetical protein